MNVFPKTNKSVAFMTTLYNQSVKGTCQKYLTDVQLAKIQKFRFTINRLLITSCFNNEEAHSR